MSSRCSLGGRAHLELLDLDVEEDVLVERADAVGRAVLQQVAVEVEHLERERPRQARVERHHELHFVLAARIHLPGGLRADDTRTDATQRTNRIGSVTFQLQCGLVTLQLQLHALPRTAIREQLWVGGRYNNSNGASASSGVEAHVDFGLMIS